MCGAELRAQFIGRPNVQHQEILFACAEFAIGIAGFSAIVVAIGYRGGNWDEVTRYIFGLLLFYAIGAGLFALLPAALFTTGLSEESVWRIASAFYLFFIGSLLRFVFAVSGSIRGQLSALARWGGITVNLMASAGLLLNTLGLLYRPQAAPYVLTVLFFLVAAATNFARVVFRRPDSAA